MALGFDLRIALAAKHTNVLGVTLTMPNIRVKMKVLVGGYDIKYKSFHYTYST